MELQSVIAQVLLNWILFIPLLTFHEFAHAWVAWKCGDDTAYQQGRVTLNPIAHMELIGTVVLPLAAMFLGAAGSSLAGFIIGWGKPVPVNLNNLSRPRLQDSLIAMAGPAMNVALAIVLLGLCKLILFAYPTSAGHDAVNIFSRMAELSLFLCFFNLIPIPPLDGSHILCHATQMRYETYINLCRYGFIMVIAAVQIPFVLNTVGSATDGAFSLIERLWNL